MDHEAMISWLPRSSNPSPAHLQLQKQEKPTWSLLQLPFATEWLAICLSSQQ